MEIIQIYFMSTHVDLSISNFWMEILGLLSQKKTFMTSPAVKPKGLRMTRSRTLT